ELRAREGVWWTAADGEVTPLTADGAILWANITAC
ncbi:MAG TPA: HutD family protein, partial [Serratia marcescens]|nr:HutD family protein [Serratia marcescens]